MFRRILVTLITLLIEFNVQGQHFNFQPCYEYWKLTDKLRKGEKPTTEEWNKLRVADGYKRKPITEKAWKGFIDRVSLVYTPGNKELIHQKIKSDLQLQWIIQYAKEEANLKEYISKLEHMHLMDSAKAYVQQKLPPEWKNCFPEPTVDFILYDYDGSAKEYGITMDLLVSYHIETHKPGVFMGHELLHYALWYCRIKFRRFKAVPLEHGPVFTAINGISEEGTADLIDKPVLLFDEHSPYLLRDTLMSLYKTQSISCVHKINEALEKLADESLDPYTSHSYWNSLMPSSGHIPGAYMGRLIQQNGLEDKLVKHIDNPFYFFYLYNDAAQKDKNNPPVFSKKAIRFVQLMERKYLK